MAEIFLLVKERKSKNLRVMKVNKTLESCMAGSGISTYLRYMLKSLSLSELLH